MWVRVPPSASSLQPLQRWMRLFCFILRLQSLQVGGIGNLQFLNGCLLAVRQQAGPGGWFIECAGLNGLAQGRVEAGQGGVSLGGIGGHSAGDGQQVGQPCPLSRAEWLGQGQFADDDVEYVGRHQGLET